MKKYLGVALLFVLMLLTLTGCVVSESYADKVNKRAEEEDYLTYEEVIKALKDPTVNATVTTDSSTNGYCTWVRGCDTMDEAQVKIESGKTVYSLTITFVNSNATAASWNEWSTNSKE